MTHNALICPLVFPDDTARNQVDFVLSPAGRRILPFGGSFPSEAAQVRAFAPKAFLLESADMKDENRGRRLNTWKEIAAYLNCDIRTCRRWEKTRGLPVLRLPGKIGSRVMAWQKDLDEWMSGPPPVTKISPRPPATPKIKPVHKPGRRIAFVAATALIILAVAGFFGIQELTRDRQPADFRIEGSRLIILNKAKEVLWSHDTGLETFVSDAEYRERYQVRLLDPKSNFRYSPWLVIDDLDRDGWSEVLFVPKPDREHNSRALICYDRRGKERWRFDGGREMVFGKKLFSSDYATSFEVHDIDGDGFKEIFVLSEKIYEYPTQLAVLSATGRRLGEYWNSGRIMDIVMKDFDGNGRDELMIGGTTQEYLKAFIAVFDPLNLEGQSPNSEDYRCPSMRPGTELAYILLPLSDIDPYENRHVVLGLLDILDNGRIRAITSQTRNSFELDPKTLECLDMTTSVAFEVFRRDAVRKGEAHGPLDDAYRENLRLGLLYWTGRIWTSKPSWKILFP